MSRGGHILGPKADDGESWVHRYSPSVGFSAAASIVQRI
jgi:hypothetical protein